MFALGYHLKRALLGTVSRPLRLLLTLGCIALAFMLVGGIFLVAHNLARLTEGWGSGATVALDLAPDVPPADVARVRQAVLETPGVERVRWVTPAEARERLRRHLGPEARLVADVEEGFLPASFEVTLAGGRARVMAAQTRLARMPGAVPGVEAVQTVESWYHRLGRLVGGIRLLGLIFGALVLVAGAYIIAATIRLRFYDRQEEIQVMRLMGATDWFVRTPFYLEGVLQGVAGTLAAIGLLWVAFQLLTDRIPELFGGSVGASRLGFLTPTHLAWGLAVGAACGLAGAIAATRKARYA